MGGSPSNVPDESKTAILAHPFEEDNYEYRDPQAPVLKAASQETLTLMLPSTMKVSELKWISVWCRLYTVDFGHLIFPVDFKVPTAEPQAEPESEPEPAKKGDLPHPEAEAEPEPEAEAEPGYTHNHVHEDGHDHDHEHDHDHDEHEYNPNSLESKSEPEPEPASAM